MPSDALTNISLIVGIAVGVLALVVAAIKAGGWLWQKKREFDPKRKDLEDEILRRMLEHPSQRAVKSMAMDRPESVGIGGTQLIHEHSDHHRLKALDALDHLEQRGYV